MLCLAFTAGPSFAGTEWTTLKQADTAAQNKQYSVALKQYQQVIQVFINKKDTVNTALIYGRMGKCAAELNSFDQAAIFWQNEAKLWSQLGKNEDKQIALRKANAVTSEVRLFVETNAEEARALGVKNGHQTQYEPEFGLYIGAYAENDPAVHNPYDAAKRYQTDFPKLTGKEHAAYLIYLTYGDNIHKYDSHFAKSKATGTALQIALQPNKGLGMVKQDEWLLSFVKHLDSYDIPIFLRFANEMNEPSAPWFGPAKDYISAYKIVASTVKANTKHIVMCWAPAWFPPDTVDAYYPGDAFVDWVGVSMYRAYNPQLDPLSRNVDRESYLQKLDRIYNTYSAKKPIYIAEGGVSFTDIKTGKDYTTWAVREIQKFYAYLPMLYPKTKAMFWFDTTRVVDKIPRSYRLSDNSTILKAYSDAIATPIYLSKVNQSADLYYHEVKNGQLPKLGRDLVVDAYVKTVDPDIEKVIFTWNGKFVSEANSLPYSFKLTSDQLSSGPGTLNMKALGKQGKILTEKTLTLK